VLPDKLNSEILLYNSNDGKLKIQVRLENDTVWLTQADMVELFQSSKSNISEHIKNIFEDGELQENSVVRKFRTVRLKGSLSLQETRLSSGKATLQSGKGTLQSGKGTLQSGKGTLHSGKGTLHGGNATLYSGKGTLHGGI
jgi:hypothetical protein